MFNKRAILLFYTLVLLLTSGCIYIPLVAATYVPCNSALDSLKRQNVSRLAVEPVEPTDPNEQVNKITLLGQPLISPAGIPGSYAKYLEDALKSDLAVADLLDPDSLLRLSAYLLKNDINPGFGWIGSTGHGIIKAKFNINRNGKTLFDKTIDVETDFESHIVGAISRQNAQKLYPYLVRALLEKSYSDPEFIKALQN